VKVAREKRPLAAVKAEGEKLKAWGDEGAVGEAAGS